MFMSSLSGTPWETPARATSSQGSSPRRWRCGVGTFGILLLLATNLHADPPKERKAQAPPSRIIAVGPNSAEVLCSLGACDAIVGVSRYCVFPPEVLDRPNVGGLFDPDLEKMLSLRPDLIVLRGKNQVIEELAKSSRIPVYRDETDSLAGIETCVRDLGGILHREAHAESVVARFHERLDRVRRRVAGRARPRVLLTISRAPERMSDLLTASRGTFLAEMLEIAGGENAFRDIDLPYPKPSTESIVARRPEVIIELMPDVAESDLADARRRALDAWRRLGPIPAVEQDRVYLLNDNHALIPSPRFVEIVEKVADLLHPGE